MKLWLNISIYLILGVICVGCINKNRQYLSLAAEYMEVSPDSAVAILEKVENIGKESDSQYAYFALLWTQARHKCHLLLDNDSLITFATDYYTKHGNRHLAAKAFLYKGLVHKGKKEVEKAVEAFAMSAHWFEGVEDDQYKALLYNHYGLLMMSEKNYEEALCHLKKSYHFKLKGDSIHYIMSACASIAKNFKYLNQLDSSQIYFEKGLQYKDKVDSRRYYLYAKDYANFLRMNKLYGKAENLLLECEQYLTDGHRYSVYSSLATLYYETEDYAKALRYAEKMQDSRDSLMMRGCYFHLYRIHARLGDKDVSHEYYKKYTDIHDAIQERVKTKEVAVIPHKVEKQMLVEENQKGRVLRGWLMAVIVVLTMSAFMIHRNQRNRHQRKQDEMSRKILKSEEMHQQVQQELTEKLTESEKAHRIENILRKTIEEKAKEDTVQYLKERENMQNLLTEKSVEIGNLKSVITNKNRRIGRMETEGEENKIAIKRLKNDVDRLKKEEYKSQKMEKRLQKEMSEQLHCQMELEHRVLELEREQRIHQLVECCAQHQEKEKLMELLDYLKGSESCSIKNSEYATLVKELVNMIYPGIVTSIEDCVSNEKKRVICQLVILGFDDVATIQKIVPLNEKSVRKYRKECRELVQSLESKV